METLPTTTVPLVQVLAGKDKHEGEEQKKKEEDGGMSSYTDANKALKSLTGEDTYRLRIDLVGQQYKLITEQIVFTC